MKILFSMRHAGALRNFASTIRRLAERGHHLHLAFVMPDKFGAESLVWDLTATYPNITHSDPVPAAKKDYPFWLLLARGVRYWADYLRYLGPEHSDADKLRERAADPLPRFLIHFSTLPLVNSARGRRWLAAVLRTIEQALPSDPSVDATITVQQPDIVLLTPLVDLGSEQVEYVKSARARGIHTALCVHSWDNLTNKGLIRIPPDRVHLWNEVQKREAVEMHGLQPEQVVVTGAPAYDQWFARTPSTTRDEFCAKVGLPADRPFIVYLCSSRFIAPDEAEFIHRWVQALREPRSAATECVRNASILVRPHPQNLQPWHKFDFARFGNVAIWPAGGSNPVDDDSRNDFYDSLFHSVLAVGVNTSAQIEAGIVGRPVFTIETDEHADTQAGTLHFQYLLEAGGGLVHSAKSFDEHIKQLTQAFVTRPEETARLKSFIEAFVRPHGLDVPATPLLVEGIEALGRLPRPAPRRTPVWLLPLRWLLAPVAAVLNVSRKFGRMSRKRARQLRPLTIVGFILKPLSFAFDLVLRWRPVKAFVTEHVVPKVVPHKSPYLPTEETITIPRIIHKLHTHRVDQPLIVGPWLGGVGYEMLYWVPFLRWATGYRHFDPERLVIVSRGGVAPWYAGIGARYVDLFDFYTPEQLQQRHNERMAEGQTEQRAPTSIQGPTTTFDREVSKLVRLAIDCRDAQMLHPMHMFRLFEPYWQRRASLDLIESFTSFERLPAVDAPDISDTLPDDYIAVRFYYNSAFPETTGNVEFVRRLLTRVTETTDVVLLNPGFRIDDHADLQPDVSRRIHSIDNLLRPKNNLAVQTQVISGARAFIGNYGGLSYVPPFYGVRSLAFYSNPANVAPPHLDLMYRVAARLKRGSFVALDVGSFDLLSTIMTDSTQ